MKTEMVDLTIIKQNGASYIDSREVAALIGKRHDNLLRDIGGYLKTLEKSNLLKIEGVNFFIASTYFDPKGEVRPRYLISKRGCELVANKLTGEKGVLFTVTYVTKFNAMEASERAELEARSAMPIPRLGEYNAAARLIVRALQNIGAVPERIIRFIKGLYEPLGFTVAAEDEIAALTEMFTAKDIAEIFGIYSRSGKPHNQAVACILNEILFIGGGHKSAVTVDYGGAIGVCVRYDEHALYAVENWLVDNKFPSEIDGLDRTYHVVYKA
jgi:Rha family phage regulatory protein